jgi:hypothetical protein
MTKDMKAFLGFLLILIFGLMFVVPAIAWIIKVLGTGLTAWYNLLGL